LFSFPLENPHPDFESLQRVILGQAPPEYVLFVELNVDEEMQKYVLENLMGQTGGSCHG